MNQTLVVALESAIVYEEDMPMDAHRLPVAVIDPDGTVKALR